MIDYKYEFDHWLRSEQLKLKKRASFKKKFIGSRGYPHFDTLLSIYDANHIGILQHNFTDPKNLLKWRFLPFIRNDQRNRRYRKKPAVASPIKHRNQKLYSHIKSRPIMYASHHDACLYSFFNFIISKRYEEKLQTLRLEESVLAYRSIKGQNNIDFAKKAFDFIGSTSSDWACLLVDLSSFFDNVPHEQLIKALYALDDEFKTNDFDSVISSLTSFRYVIEDGVIKELKRQKRPYFVPMGQKAVKLCKIEDFNKYINNKKFIRKNRSERGFPQGSPISGLLANIFMMNFDEWVQDKVDGYNFGMYQRYSDDILVVCPKENVASLYNEIQKKLKKDGISLSRKKTEVFVKNGKRVRSAPEIIHVSGKTRERVQYLGLEWDGEEIILRPATVTRRLRPKNKLAKKYWRYHEQAIDKIGQRTVSRQYRRIKNTIRLKIEGDKNENL